MVDDDRAPGEVVSWRDHATGAIRNAISVKVPPPSPHGSEVTGREQPIVSAPMGVGHSGGRPGRGPRRLAAAAGCALVALLTSACDGSSGATTVTSPIETTPAETVTALVEHPFELPPFPTLRAQAPSTWGPFDDWGLIRNACADRDGRCDPTDSTMAITFWGVTEIYRHPCRWLGPTITPGPTVADLATALQSIPIRNASEPEPVKVGGFDGLYMQWSVPDEVDFDDCDEGFFESWRGDITGTDRYQQAPGQVDRLWILDIEGQRLVIDAFYLPGTPEEDRHEIDDIIDSIRFSTS
jgi:hypothetical protein